MLIRTSTVVIVRERFHAGICEQGNYIGGSTWKVMHPDFMVNRLPPLEDLRALGNFSCADRQMAARMRFTSGIRIASLGEYLGDTCC